MLLFVQTPFDAAKQSVLGVRYQVFAGVRKKRTKFVEWIHVAVFAIFSNLFSNKSSRSQSVSSYTLADAIPYEKPYNIARFRLFPEFLSIESDVIKLDTA